MSGSSLRYQNNSELQCANARAKFDTCRAVADTAVPHRDDSPYCDEGCRNYFTLGMDVELLYEVNLLDFVVEFMSLIMLLVSISALFVGSMVDVWKKNDKLFFNRFFKGCRVDGCKKKCQSLFKGSAYIMVMLLVADLALQAIALETARRAEPLATEMKECVNIARNAENRDTLVGLTDGMSTIISLGLGELVLGVLALVASIVTLVWGVNSDWEEKKDCNCEVSSFVVELASTFVDAILTSIEFFFLTQTAKEDSDALLLSIQAREEWCITLSDECTEVVREAAGPASFKTSLVDRTLGVTLLVVLSLVVFSLIPLCRYCYSKKCGSISRPHISRTHPVPDPTKTIHVQPYQNALSVVPAVA